MDAPVRQSVELGEPGHGAPVTLRLFAAARQLAGTARATAWAATVGEVIDEAAHRFGPAWSAVAATSRTWVNGEPADVSRWLQAGDEVAVLPPVSGGAGPLQAGSHRREAAA